MKSLIVNLILIPILMISCKSQNGAEKIEKAVPVKIVAVEYHELSKPIYTNGLLTSSTTMKLAFKVGGIIENCNVDEGDKVQKGQILAELKLDEIQAQVNLARLGLAKAQRDYNRVKNLYADSVATLEQLQDVETAFQIARSQLDIAEFNLEFSTITAPETGYILKRLAEENEMISAGFPVFILGTTDQAWIVRVGVTDRDIIRLTPGDSASISFDVYPGDTFVATVGEIASAPDPANGTYEIELILQTTNYKLVNGFTARVTLFSSQKETLAVIPVECMVEAEGDQAFVFIPTDSNTTKKVQITIAFLYDGRVAVKNGLETISEIITEGAAYLKPGISISIIE